MPSRDGPVDSDPTPRVRARRRTSVTAVTNGVGCYVIRIIGGMTASAWSLAYLLIIGALGVWLWLRVRRARKAGAFDARPCCVRCWYPLGSWSAPSCPECGSDARSHGVAIGPRSGRVIALVLVLLIAGGALVAGLAAARAIDPVALMEIDRTWVSEKTGVIVRFDWAYRGPLDRESAVEHWARGSLEFLRQNARPTDPAMKVLRFDSHERPLSLDDVRAALMDAAGETGAAEPVDIAQDAVALSLAIDEFQRQFSFSMDSREGRALIGRWSEMSGGGSMSQHASPRSVIAAVAAVALLLIGGTVAVIRFVGPGTRPVREGEWTSAVRASTAK